MKTQKIINTLRILAAALLVSIAGITYAAEAKNSSAKMSIVEIASSEQNFSILVEAVAKADLVGALSADGPYTVFAPTNEAFELLFESLGVSGINDLTKEDLTPILLYHVVQGKVMAADVSTGTVATLNSSADMNVKVSKKGVKIDKRTNVIATDIEASNGVIHVIDAVLIPSSDDQASNSKGSCGSY
jgi:transforming growth factor-beta-induced protein